MASEPLSIGLACGTGSAIATGIASKTGIRIKARQARDEAAFSFEKRFTNKSVQIER